MPASIAIAAPRVTCFTMSRIPSFLIRSGHWAPKTMRRSICDDHDRRCRKHQGCDWCSCASPLGPAGRGLPCLGVGEDGRAQVAQAGVFAQNRKAVAEHRLRSVGGGQDIAPQRRVSSSRGSRPAAICRIASASRADTKAAW